MLINLSSRKRMETYMKGIIFHFSSCESEWHKENATFIASFAVSSCVSVEFAELDGVFTAEDPLNKLKRN